MAANDPMQERTIRAPTLEALESMALMMEGAGWERVGRADVAWEAVDGLPIRWVQRLRRASLPGDDPVPPDAH